jgi:polar amino acid transport system substrate-binding protein
MLQRLLLLLPFFLILGCQNPRLDPDKTIFLRPVSKPKYISKADNDLELIRKRGLVRVGIKKHAPPFSLKGKDGQYEGFDVEIAKAIASYLEVTLKLVPLDSKDRIPFLNNNKVDLVIATMTVTRSREESVDFSIPYFQDGQALLGLKSSDIDGYRGLKNKKVAVVDGTTSQSNMPQVQPNCQLVPFKTPQQALKALLNKDVEAFTSDAMMLIGLSIDQKNGDQLEIKGDKFTVEPYGIAMRQNQSKLRDLVNEGIMDLWKSGSWKRQFEMWFGEDTPYHSKNYFTVDVIE